MDSRDEASSVFVSRLLALGKVTRIKAEMVLEGRSRSHSSSVGFAGKSASHRLLVKSLGNGVGSAGTDIQYIKRP